MTFLIDANILGDGHFVESMNSNDPCKDGVMIQVSRDQRLFVHITRDFIDLYSRLFSERDALRTEVPNERTRT